jgi:hypothetical protein
VIVEPDPVPAPSPARVPDPPPRTGFGKLVDAIF